MKTEVRKYYEDGSVDYEQGVIVCDCNDYDHSVIYWKQESPINSRINELQGTNLSSISTKYFKNLIKLFAVI